MRCFYICSLLLSLMITLQPSVSAEEVKGETSFSEEKFLPFDKEKFLRDEEERQQIIQTEMKLQRWPFKNHKYCVRCSDGGHFNCNTEVGGDGGRIYCSIHGIARCLGGKGSVRFGICK